MERESFNSRLGFLLISAGCAIGIGNVWRFPYITGKNGGGLFVLLYLFFLVLVGVPVMTMEFALGRASKQSTVRAYHVLEPEGSKWHLHGYVAMIGNYVLMSFYTTVAGWMLYYFYEFSVGHFQGLDPEGVSNAFGGMLSQPGVMSFWMMIVIIVGFSVCSLGLQRGVERVTKVMMLALLGIILILAVRSLLLPGAMEGLKFYLLPDLDKAKEVGIGTVIVEAMNQSFFTLSLGIGAMLIFGSYLQQHRTLLGESINIAVLDTFVAVVSGLIIFPACFAFGVNPDSGPRLIFITLPNVFNSMAGGRVWGALFFLFMTFAAFSTILAVFENLIRCCMDAWDMSRKKAVWINFVIVSIISIPCVLGFNRWSAFQPLGAGTNILDLEDFLVSTLLLPIGSLIYLFFCVSRWGWGFDKYLAEANAGKGPKMPRWLRKYLTWVLPIFVVILLVQGIGTTVMKLIAG